MGVKALLALALLFLSACAVAPPLEQPQPLRASTIWLFRAETAIQDEWQHVPLRGETEYRLSAMDGEIGIRAVGRRSASGLFRYVDLDPRHCVSLKWTWRVDSLQPDADLRVKEREDVAASIFLLFGDPGFLFDPKPVPTLRYVWTNGHVPEDTVIDNPYMPGVVRSLVVRSGDEHIGKWLHEERNLAADFETAFGYPPEDTVHAVALFTDNDQTGQAVEAYYGWASVECAIRDGSAS